MKRAFYYSLPLLLSALILSSCSSSVDIMKRKYNRGFHIDARNDADAQNEAVKAVIAKENNNEKAAPSIIEERSEEAERPLENEELACGSSSVVTSLTVNAAASPSKQKTGEVIAKKVLTFHAKALKKAQSRPGDGIAGNQLIALILCFFVGVIGIHRFYLGYYGAGLIQLLTLGACGIWTLIDFIRIITGDLKPKDGEYRKKFSDL